MSMTTSMPGGGMMPMPQPRTMPNMSRGPSSSGQLASRGQSVGDTRAKATEDNEAGFGGDACLCLEFSGSLVAAAAWDAQKRCVVALPTNDEKGEARPSRSRVDVVDAEKLEAWLSKPAKAKAAEIHTAGVTIGSDALEKGVTRIERPGNLLGGPISEKVAKNLVKGNSFAVSVAPRKKKQSEDSSSDSDSDDEDFGLGEVGRFSLLKKTENKDFEVSAEALVALLAARPRQRATQLVAKPVRRLTIVCPASAPQVWRRSAAEAVLSVDARAHRFVSGPLAQIAGAAEREALDLSPGDSVLSVILDEDDSLDGVLAVCEAAPLWFRVERVFASRKDLHKWLNDQKKAKVAAVLVRDVPFSEKKDDKLFASAGEVCVSADPSDAVSGAVALQASRLELLGCVKRDGSLSSRGSVDALPFPIILRAIASPPSKEDVLFDAGAELPASLRRDYALADYGKKPGEHEWPVLGAYERIDSKKLVACGAGIDDPFATVDDDGRLVYATDVTVEFFVDKRGLASSQVISVRGAPKSAAKEAKERAAKNCRRLTAASFITFLLAPIGYTLVHMRQSAVTRKVIPFIFSNSRSRAAHHRRPRRLLHAGQARQAQRRREDRRQVRGLRGVPLQAPRKAVPRLQRRPPKPKKAQSQRRRKGAA